MNPITVYTTVITAPSDRRAQRIATTVINDDPENVDRWIKDTLTRAQDAGMVGPTLHAVTYIQRGPGEVLITAIINPANPVRD